jgi:hypothetical protein
MRLALSSLKVEEQGKKMRIISLMVRANIGEVGDEAELLRWM